MLPLYEHSFDEAKRRSELDIWLASRLENMACASEIAQLIKDGQSDLREKPGQALLQEFGIDRMLWVTAMQIHFDREGYTPEELAWADQTVPAGFPVLDAQQWKINAPAEGIQAMTEQAREMYAGLRMLDVSQCSEIYTGQDVTGRLLITSPKALKDEFKKAYNQYFYAIGISENGRVEGVFLTDGLKAEYRPDRILGIADTKQLPQWAAERLAQIQMPQMQVRIFQIDHTKDPNRLAFEGSEMLPDGKVDAAMYRQIYGGTVNCSSLEELFAICNSDHKSPGYYGESMSISNVIEICDGEQKGFYYCDHAGFKPIDFDISQTDHAQMLRVLICEPGKEAYTAEIQDCLEAKQAVVGGLIEPVYFDRDGEVFAYCNDEGLLEQLPLNRRVGSQLIVGPIMIAGEFETDDGYVEKSLTDEQLAKWGEVFRYPLISMTQEEAQMYDTEPIISDMPEQLIPAQF
ncbi:MAG: DUF3846 domain-containing protein [Oscillospiraceae bacterium]|nr:DUF3846 domain-containing protein [Oscillospiraceae bacterium]